MKREPPCACRPLGTQAHGAAGGYRAGRGSYGPHPPKTVSADDKTQLQNLEVELKKVIYGQDTAIDSLVTAIKLSRSGLGSPEKPVGCFPILGADRRRQDRARQTASPASWALSFCAST